jgi:hypothetical protein
MVGQTQLTLAMSVLPALGSSPMSSTPYAAMFARKRSARARLLRIVAAPPE